MSWRSINETVGNNFLNRAPCEKEDPCKILFICFRRFCSIYYIEFTLSFPQYSLISFHKLSLSLLLVHDFTVRSNIALLCCKKNDLEFLPLPPLPSECWITGITYQVWIRQCWGWNPWRAFCMLSTLSTNVVTTSLASFFSLFNIN